VRTQLVAGLLRILNFYIICLSGPAFCPFSPFQVISYRYYDPVTKFTHDDPNVELKSCSLRKAWAKFPDNATEVEVSEWLDETYVDLKVSSHNTLDLGVGKFKKCGA
jgi:hypothetical protein